MGIRARRLSVYSALLLLTACAATGPRERQVIPDIEVAVFYGTDRNRQDASGPENFYGEGRGECDYGVVHISGAGQDSPWRLEAVEPRPRQQFLAELQVAIAQAEKPEAVVFVHGYQRSFREASKSVAAFVHLTGFHGVPILWSWPSTNNAARYTADETNLRWAQRDFARFLQDILTRSGAQAVHLVGHSLGGRGLAETVLHRLIPGGVDLSPIGQLVLLAPDIDQDIFRRDVAPALVEAGLRVTLYTSANDMALFTAYGVHGHRRAGDSSGGPLVVPGVQTIDVTAVNRSLLGHSYFDRSEMVAQDLAQLLNEGLPADQRGGLVPETLDGRLYWRLSVDH